MQSRERATFCGLNLLLPLVAGKERSLTPRSCGKSEGLCLLDQVTHSLNCDLTKYTWYLNTQKSSRFQVPHTDSA